MLRQCALRNFDEAFHLETNRIHQTLAFTTANCHLRRSHVMAAAQLDDLRQIR